MTHERRTDQGEAVHRSFQISTRNRVAAVALAIAVMALGGVFVVFGLVLLVGLAAVGTVLGAGAVAYHRLMGRWPRFLRRRAAPRGGLDPSLEVLPGAPTGGGRPAHNEARLPPP